MQVRVDYSWPGGQLELDTRTTFVGEADGFACGDGGRYVGFVSGGQKGGGRAGRRGGGWHGIGAASRSQAAPPRSSGARAPLLCRPRPSRSGGRGLPLSTARTPSAVRPCAPPDRVRGAASRPHPNPSQGDQVSGQEVVLVDVLQAYKDGAVWGAATIGLAAGWYMPAGGSGPATLTVGGLAWSDDWCGRAGGSDRIYRIGGRLFFHQPDLSSGSCMFQPRHGAALINQAQQATPPTRPKMRKARGPGDGRRRDRATGLGGSRTEFPCVEAAHAGRSVRCVMAGGHGSALPLVTGWGEIDAVVRPTTLCGLGAQVWIRHWTGSRARAPSQAQRWAAVGHPAARRAVDTPVKCASTYWVPHAKNSKQLRWSPLARPCAPRGIERAAIPPRPSQVSSR